MKKVVYICESLGGGVRRHIVDLLSNININKFELHVIHGSKRVDEIFLIKKEELGEKGIFFYPVDTLVREISITNDFRSFKEIKDVIKMIRPDVVHCHSSKAGAIGRMAAKVCGIKKVFYTPHAYAFQNPNLSSKKKLIYKSIEKVLGYFTTMVIHVSKGEEEYALENKIISSKKSIVIYNGIPTPVMHSEQKDTAGKMVIGTVARMDSQKNPWLFIQIAEQVISRNTNVEFVYIGDGEYFGEILEYIRKNNLEKYIKLKGFHSNPEAELAGFDIFLSTSLYEGMPYSLIEALSYKKPIVATNVIGNNEIVIDKFNGFLFNLNDVKNASDKLLDLINNKEHFHSLSINSFKSFEDNFLIEKMISSIEELYI